MVKRRTNLLLGGKDISLGLLGALLANAAEIGIVDVVGHRDTRNVQLGARGDDVVLMHSAHRNTVDLVGSYIFIETSKY